MANKIDEVVQIVITRQTQGLTARGFGIPAIIGESMKLDRRSKSYANISEVEADFDSSDVEYKMASIAFSQEISPQEIYIGKKINVAGGAAVVSATQISGTTVNFQITGHNLEQGVTIDTTGFTPAAYNGSFVITEITDANNIQVELLSDPLGDATVVGTYGATETWADAVQEVFDFDPSWYALTITSNVKADIKEVAAKIESLGLLFLARTSDVDNLDSIITTSLMAELKALNYDRTMTTYNADSANKYIDIAWASELLPTIPGSNNWAYNDLIGVSTDKLTSAQSSSVLQDNNGNTYETINGLNLTRFGKVASGEFVDIIRGSDWLKARIQERILLELSFGRIPYTNQGIAIVENLVREILDIGAANGFIRTDSQGNGIYTITSPLVDDVPVQNKIDRFLPDINFEAELAGAINTVSIKGVLKL
jgi:hypothetical protein